MNNAPRPGQAGNALKVDRNRLHPGSQKSLAIPDVYTDETIICRGCRKGFVFTAQQKKRLYEEHKLHFAAKRVLCGDCKNDLLAIDKLLAAFDGRLKPKGQKQEVTLQELPRMMDLLKRKFTYTQKVDKSKMAQYKRIYNELAGG